MELFDYEIDIDIINRYICPRDVINGIVKIKVRTALFITHAYIEISGKAQCNWSEKTGFFKTNTVNFNGSQEFFFCKHTLAGNEGNELIMERKIYSYPFKCKLPGNLPPTWIGQHGNIKYAAVIMLKSEEETVGMHGKEITVYPFRSLTQEPHLLIEAQKSVTKTMHFGFINLGKVKLTVWLPLCGISSGQSIPLVCTVENKSSVLFGGIVFVLTQIQVFRSNAPYYKIKTVRTDICRVARFTQICKGVEQFYCVLKTDDNIFPTTQYWRCSTCQLIYEVWAQLQASLPMNKAYGNPNINLPGIPLIIGTHPFYNWQIDQINEQVERTLMQNQVPLEMDPPPPDEIVDEILNNGDEEFDAEMMTNLSKQITFNQDYHKSSENES